MEKMIIVCLALCLWCGGVTAQTQKTDEAKVQALKVKKNVDYIYGEASGDSEEGLYEAAHDVLVNRIQNFVATQNDMGEADGFLVENIQKKCKRISYTRNLKTYVVCLYVKKSDIQPLYRNKNSETDVEPETEDTADEVPVVKPSAKAEPVQESPKETVVPEPVESREPVSKVPEPVSKTPKTETPKPATELPKQEVPEPVSEAPKPETKPAEKPVPVAALSACSEKERAVLGTILGMKTYGEVEGMLKKRKLRNHDVMYGLVADMEQKDCFWVVFDKERHVVVVLDKSASVDLKSGAAVNGRATYLKHPKLWLQIF